ncbi:MAG: nucleotidyltransferase family protein [Cyanophyceae cyanobacterium]
MTEAIAQRSMKLLLLCARTCFSVEVASSIRVLLQQELDWSYLLETAAAHSVMPLLFNGLQATCPQAVPPPVFAQLRKSFQANALHNLFLTNELLKLLKLFQAQQIGVVPYKGPLLAALVYGNSALRTFCDLDIVVRKQDVLRAKELLLAHGYQRLSQLTPAQEARLLHSEYEYKFIRQDGKVLLELHWGNAARYSPFCIDLEPFWKRVEPVTFHGITLAQFQREDLLILLCIHGAKDQWRELKWICDVHELCTTPLNWSQVQQRAERLGVQRLVTLGLLLAQNCLGTELPPELLKEAIAYSVAAQIQARLFLPGNYKLAERWLVSMSQLGETWPEKLRYLAPLLVPNERDLAMLALPQRLAFLYYLIRPLRVVGKYGLGWGNRRSLRSSQAAVALRWGKGQGLGEKS